MGKCFLPYKALIDLTEGMTLGKDLKDIRWIFGGRVSQAKGTSKVPEARMCMIPLEKSKRGMAIA